MNAARYPLVRVFAAALLCSCMAPTTSAAPISGAWSDGEMTITFAAADDAETDRCSGQIEMGGQKYPFTATTTDAGVLAGAFKAGGESFEFTASVTGNSITLSSDGTDYRLTRKGGAGNKNPLKRKPKPNPLGRRPAGDDDAPPPQPEDEPPPDTDDAPKAPAGIGVALDDSDGRIIVRGVAPGGPAQKAGVEAGMTIVAVNGRTTEGVRLDRVGPMIQGPAGTTVTITVATEDGRQRDIKVRRAPLSGAALEKNRFRHPSGVFSVAAPDGWRRSTGQNGMQTKFTHGATGTYVEVLLLPDPGFRTAEEFYRKWMRPSLVENKAQIHGEDNHRIAGRDAYAVMFTPAGKQAAAMYALALIPNHGLIVHIEAPESEYEATQADIGQILGSLRLERTAGEEAEGAENAVRPGTPEPEEVLDDAEPVRPDLDE